jgi:hypothetical protein
VAVHRVVEASAAHPQLGVEGDTMAVMASRGRVSATMVGPDDTIQGQYPPPKTTPCTFVLTLTNAQGTVPINPADFTILDEEGNLYHPKVSMAGGPPPSTAPINSQVILNIKEVLPTGSGQLRWAAGAAAPVALWDYSVEID